MALAGSDRTGLESGPPLVPSVTNFVEGAAGLGDWADAPVAASAAKPTAISNDFILQTSVDFAQCSTLRTPQRISAQRISAFGGDLIQFSLNLGQVRVAERFGFILLDGLEGELATRR